MAPSAMPLRARLVTTFYHDHRDHRPELADLVISAELLPDREGLWVQPSAAFSDLSPAWLEPKLFAAAISSGLAVAWVHVLPGTPVVDALAAPSGREGN